MIEGFDMACGSRDADGGAGWGGFVSDEHVLQVAGSAEFIVGVSRSFPYMFLRILLCRLPSFYASHVCLA